jgi:hypothetical protein
VKTSEQIDSISKALHKLQGDLKAIPRTKVVKTKQYEFRYAPLDSIMEYLTPIMQRCELSVMQAVDMDCITTRVMHTSGQFIESTTHLNQSHSTMQGFGGEVTYKRRYSLCALLGIVSDDDTDAPKIPAKGAADEEFAGLEPRRQIFLKNLAEVIKEAHSAGNEWGAYEDYTGLDSQEERAAIWSLLPAPVRTTLTNLRKAENEKAKA